ncbi:MAG: alpha/beta fold hydrolase [Rhodospirillales bacterium]
MVLHHASPGAGNAGARRDTALGAALNYHAPSWLPGGDLQTIYAARSPAMPRVQYRRESWDTPDGDFIDLDWIAGRAGRPLVALFHGLEGCAQSHYALALMAALERHGWNGVVVHFRGCGGQPNRKLRAYHSGDAAEIDWVLRRLRERHAEPLFAAGVSLGGNALLKWLGEQGGKAHDVVMGAAAVSAPMDLAAGGHALGRGFNMVYTRMFLATLKRKSLVKLRQFPGAFDEQALRRARTLYEFDNVVTAPLHGFRDTDDYWARASSKPGLNNIRVPTLVLNARNDPFVPAPSLPTPADVPDSVTLEQPAQGGHCGFVSRTLPRQPQLAAASVDRAFRDRAGAAARPRYCERPAAATRLRPGP